MCVYTQYTLYMCVYRSVCLCMCLCIHMNRGVAWGEMEMTQITKNKWEQPTRIATLWMIRRILKRDRGRDHDERPAVTASVKLTSAPFIRTHTHTYVHSHTHKRWPQLHVKEPPYKTRCLFVNSIFQMDIMLASWFDEDDLCLKICSTHTHTHKLAHIDFQTHQVAARRLLLLPKQGSSPLVTFRRAPPRESSSNYILIMP